MKRIRISTGIKRIEDSDANTTLFRLRDILMEQRSVLIGRILSDLSTYVDYKFKLKVPPKEQEAIRDHLTALRHAPLDLDRYHDLVEQFHRHDMLHIGTDPFLKEIDEGIGAILNAAQLKLVR